MKKLWECEGCRGEVIETLEEEHKRRLTIPVMFWYLCPSCLEKAQN